MYVNRKSDSKQQQHQHQHLHLSSLVLVQFCERLYDVEVRTQRLYNDVFLVWCFMSLMTNWVSRASAALWSNQFQLFEVYLNRGTAGENKFCMQENDADVVSKTHTRISLCILRCVLSLPSPTLSSCFGNTNCEHKHPHMRNTTSDLLPFDSEVSEVWSSHLMTVNLWMNSRSALFTWHLQTHRGKKLSGESVDVSVTSRWTDLKSEIDWTNIWADWLGGFLNIINNFHRLSLKKTNEKHWLRCFLNVFKLDDFIQKVTSHLQQQS